MSRKPNQDPEQNAAIDADALEAMIEAEVVEAVRAHAAEYPPEVLDEYRHMLRIILRTHPTAKHLLEQLRPRVVPDESENRVDVRAFNGLRVHAKKAGSK
jgi:hypothetical protein